MGEDIEAVTDSLIDTQLPRAEDNVERIVRYSLVGRPDFAYNHGGDRLWAPWDLMIRFGRHTTYRGGLVVERVDWRLMNVELHAWMRLRSGTTSDKVDVLIEFDDLPSEYRPRGFRDNSPVWRKAKAGDFPYVREMIDACTPQAGELC
jgi:hypothetical protein